MPAVTRSRKRPPARQTRQARPSTKAKPTRPRSRSPAPATADNSDTEIAALRALAEATMRAPPAAPLSPPSAGGAADARHAEDDRQVPVAAGAAQPRGRLRRAAAGASTRVAVPAAGRRVVSLPTPLACPPPRSFPESSRSEIRPLIYHLCVVRSRGPRVGSAASSKQSNFPYRSGGVRRPAPRPVSKRVKFSQMHQHSDALVESRLVALSL